MSVKVTHYRAISAKAMRSSQNEASVSKPHKFLPSLYISQLTPIMPCGLRIAQQDSI